MPQELDTLRKEIDASLEKSDLVVFHGMARFDASSRLVRWDAENFPSPDDFLRAAQRLEIRLIVYNHRTFDEKMLEHARQQLELTELSREEYREIDRSLSKLNGYVGFTCSLQLSFDYLNNTYVYESLAPWFREFLDILEEVDDVDDFADDDEDEEDPLTGYYSQN